MAYRYDEKREELTYRHRITVEPDTMLADPCAVLCLCRCYQYQACEHPEWEYTEAANLTDRLTARVLIQLGSAELCVMPEYGELIVELHDRTELVHPPCCYISTTTRSCARSSVASPRRWRR